ncbi:potassium uptake protein, TrkH family [Alkaliphilus metalliredigens QYMF]|uniref:Potassium uptake protein, TrkH family n=1 Tax=Alkaliphilus metalliredigens (strain QYMF) TaxID=293826 RepID=A6TTC1_ALKMQ|nr:TrkH family potassium uptake protein [Alkaliphilus metalliredigens]ABR49439.1 potassium uptake protein, TrkH family [Alkaliphilus metalliredigens QYMF]
MQSKIKPRFDLTYAKLSAIGFLIIILVGAILLSLPIASRSGDGTPFLNALFTATSATGVTGLVVYDTYSHFSIFGQSVILVLIQIGGLGFMIIATMFLLLLRKKIGIRERSFLQESVNTIHIGGVVRLVKHILVGTLIFEAIGAIILAIKFSREMGIKPGIFNGIFHSVSAFNNAGFDLMGRYEAYSSLTRYSGDAVINITIMTLVVVGGIGFIVWEDIYKNKYKFKKYQLHSKIVLFTTALLIFGSAIAFYVFERNNLLVDTGVKESVLSSLFQAITPRTAGFNTIDTAALSEGSKLLTMMLMIIGGSSGSTAGGIKTTTFIITILSVISLVRHSEDLNIFGRRLEDSVLKRAYSIITMYIIGACVGMLLISLIQPGLALSDITFEVLSATGTVGLSTGITRDLNVLSRLIITVLMFCGRIGSLAVLMAVVESKNSVLVKNPLEKIVIG